MLLFELEMRRARQHWYPSAASLHHINMTTRQLHDGQGVVRVMQN